MIPASGNILPGVNTREAKPVQIVGLTLSGTDATNYTLTQPTTLANITAAALTVNGITLRSKVLTGRTPSPSTSTALCWRRRSTATT